MKKALYIAGISFVLIACNNTDETSNSTENANHNTHQSDSTPSNHTTSTSVPSMMSIMQKNMDQMKSMTSTGNPDTDFAAMMKTHHMGAVEMAQLELEQGTNSQLKQM